MKKLEEFLELRNSLTHIVSRIVAYSKNIEKTSYEANSRIAPLIREIVQLLNELTSIDENIFNLALKEGNKLIKFVDWCNKRNKK